MKGMMTMEMKLITNNLNRKKQNKWNRTKEMIRMMGEIRKNCLDYFDLNFFLF
jgi:hypothetical protein